MLGHLLKHTNCLNTIIETDVEQHMGKERPRTEIRKRKTQEIEKIKLQLGSIENCYKLIQD